MCLQSSQLGRYTSGCGPAHSARPHVSFHPNAPSKVKGGGAAPRGVRGAKGGSRAVATTLPGALQSARSELHRKAHVNTLPRLHAPSGASPPSYALPRERSTRT